MIRGTPKFDGLAVGEFTANFLSPTIRLHAKAAFIDTKSGATCGWTEGTNWSPDTLAKVQELRLAVERDLAMMHFSGGGEQPMAVSTPALTQGLGEHLGADGDGQQI